MKRSEPNVSSFLFILTAAVALWIFPFFYPADSGRTGQSQAKEPAFHTLTLHVDYRYDAQESFEVCRDLLVSADEGFTSTFQPFVRQYSGNHAVYTYRSENPFTKVYVKPPSVCLSTEIIPIIVSMSEGKRRAELDGQEWFTVSSVDIEKSSDGIFDLTLTVTPAQDTDAYPSEAVLFLNYTALPGSSSYHMENSGSRRIFAPGTFTFQYHDPSEDDISPYLDRAKFIVKKAYLPTDDANCDIYSDTAGVELVIAEPASGE